MLTQRSGQTSRRNFLTTSLSAAESRPRRIVLRSSWQTVNIGDIGLGEWLFNLDEASEIPSIVPAVFALAKDPAAAKAKAMKAKAFVLQRQRKTMQVLVQSL
jgi:hypothetical protein